jgi:sigma-B regulation protein RsbU (phosphoserine phosphatase)
MDNKKYKILLIDDDAMTRILFRDSFLIYGKNEFEVYTASNFEEAEQYLKESKPDLIFLDLIFKDEHGEKPKGLEILKTLKLNPKYKDINVIVYSGYEELEKEVMQYGAKKFITKGFVLPKELVNSVRSLIAELKNE